MGHPSYLLFDGSCKQAMEFYKSCCGRELTEIPVKDSPAKDFMPAFQHEKILNARLKSGNVDLSASDWLRLDRTRVPGNTVSVSYTHLDVYKRQLLHDVQRLWTYFEE